MTATKELRTALERCVKSLKDQKMISVHCRPYSKVVDLIMQELASLGSDQLGERHTITGRSVDPLTFVSMIAKGENPPELERTVSISKMAEHYARHAKILDGENPEFEQINYEYPKSETIYLRRLAWELERAFGVKIYAQPDAGLLKFFGTSKAIVTCKMTMDFLIEQIREELALFASDDEREQFCQGFGCELKLPRIITDEEFDKIKNWSRTKVTPSIVDPVAVDEKIASRAADLAKKVAI